MCRYQRGLGGTLEFGGHRFYTHCTGYGLGRNLVAPLFEFPGTVYFAYNRNSDNYASRKMQFR